MSRWKVPFSNLPDHVVEGAHAPYGGVVPELASREHLRAIVPVVRAALAELPREQRDPIALGFFGGATHEEIARQTATPLGTVKTRIRTGLRKLRSALEASVAR